MYCVLVTGGLGSGKSTLVGQLCALGALSLDLDDIARGELMGNEVYIRELVERFGEGILDEGGAVVPARLAERAFASERDVHDLNAIAHPHILARVNDCMLDVHCTSCTDARVLAVEVPLLTEARELMELADEVIAVSAASDVRLQRAVARGMSAQDALARLRLQPTDAERAALADTVCPNDGGLDELVAWAGAWWDATMRRLGDTREGRRP